MLFGGAVNKQPGPDWALSVLRGRAGSVLGPGLRGRAGTGTGTGTGGSPHLPARGRRCARPGRQARAVIGRVVRRLRPLCILYKAGPGRAEAVPEFESRIRPLRSPLRRRPLGPAPLGARPAAGE